MKTRSKTAVATRIDGNVYDVRYPGRAGFDRAATYAYLRSLVKGGWQVTIDQTRHCPEGEPKFRDLNAELKAAS